MRPLAVAVLSHPAPWRRKGKPVSEAMKLTNKAVAEALDGLPDYKMHCSVLAEEAIQSALEDYQKRTGDVILQEE